MSSHLINCLSRLHCSYLFISRLRQTPKGAYPNSSDVNNSVSMWVSTNKYNPQNPRLFVCVCFQVKWKTRAHLCDSCGFLFTEQENLVISFKIWANMRVYIGLTNVVSLSFTTLETKKLYACVCVCACLWVAPGFLSLFDTATSERCYSARCFCNRNPTGYRTSMCSAPGPW